MSLDLHTLEQQDVEIVTKLQEIRTSLEQIELDLIERHRRASTRVTVEDLDNLIPVPG